MTKGRLIKIIVGTIVTGGAGLGIGALIKMYKNKKEEQETIETTAEEVEEDEDTKE